jgi:hypothetical protein
MLSDKGFENHDKVCRNRRVFDSYRCHRHKFPIDDFKLLILRIHIEQFTFGEKFDLWCSISH